MNATAETLLLHKIVDAWESINERGVEDPRLPAHKVSITDVEPWLNKIMWPVVQEIRAHLGRRLDPTTKKSL